MISGKSTTATMRYWEIVYWESSRNVVVIDDLSAGGGQVLSDKKG